MPIFSNQLIKRLNFPQRAQNLIFQVIFMLAGLLYPRLLFYKNLIRNDEQTEPKHQSYARFTVHN